MGTARRQSLELEEQHKVKHLLSQSGELAEQKKFKDLISHSPELAGQHKVKDLIRSCMLGTFQVMQSDSTLQPLAPWCQHTMTPTCPADPSEAVCCNLAELGGSTPLGGVVCGASRTAVHVCSNDRACQISAACNQLARQEGISACPLLSQLLSVA